MRGARRTGAERRVVEAFGAVRAPEGLRERTLERIEELRRVEKDAGFLTEGSVVSVTVSCDDERQYDELSAASRDCLEGSAAEVCCDHASEEERRAAHDAGMGVGKWRAWQELVSEGSGVSAEDAAGMTMRELRDLCEGDEGAGAGEGAAVGGHHGEGRHGSGRHG